MDGVRVCHIAGSKSEREKTPHTFFIHSSIDGHLCCFPILAIVNNSAVNIEVHIYFRISVFVSSDKYPEVEKLNHMIVLFLIF